MQCMDVYRIRLIQHAQAISAKAKTGHTGSPSLGLQYDASGCRCLWKLFLCCRQGTTGPLHRPRSTFCGSVTVEATWAAHRDTAQGSLCGGDGDFRSWIPLGHAADSLRCLQRAKARGGYSGCPMEVGVLVPSCKGVIGTK